MRLLLTLLWYIVGPALAIGAWFALAIAITAVMSPYYAAMGLYYSPEDGVEHATWCYVILLVWDRYFGPYGKLLRGVAKYFPGRKTETESNEYDGFDRHV